MILSIDTSSEDNSIDLYRPNGIEKKQVWNSYRTQSQELLPRIDKFLKTNNVKLSDLKAITVFQGPGSYTGLRVGIAVANTLGWSLNIPVIGLSNQESLSFRARVEGNLINQSEKEKIEKIKKWVFNSPKITNELEKLFKKNKIARFTKPITPIYS